MIISDMVNDFIAEWESFSNSNQILFDYELNENLMCVILKFTKDKFNIEHHASIMEIEYLIPTLVNKPIYEKLDNLYDACRNTIK